MVRYDLRHLHENFYDRMNELLDNNVKSGEVAIFLFEVVSNGKENFEAVQKSADLIKSRGDELLNSLKFNEVDWTIVVRKK
ncbi:MAG: hypothetical protein C6H99_07445 [Epsilonproteobacteria bacterium]|nr:hypothetical protein [Campylobacterota bacterium]NPA63673.1 hypothetical protein [Campylobacterota bacterium]